MASESSRISRSNIKGETIKVQGGLVTPNSSMSTGTLTPKREEIDDSFSDIVEGVVDSFESHNGLPSQFLEDEAYYSQTRERKARSDAPSFATSRQQSHRREGIDLTAMEVEETQPTGLEFVGEKAKKLVDAFSDLSKFGLDNVVKLPELVLVGDQSSGKSSLMSALTEVQLPRDQGICTKCPSNIKTSSATTWSCKISLMQYYKYVNPQGKVIDSKSVTKKNPFPPWVEQKLEVKDFMTIYEKSHLEVAMKWAQIALLNHDQDYVQFIPGTGRRAQAANFERERREAEAGFSPNIIAIEISGPNLPALSFYDLPGIFRVAADPRNQYLAKVIENLAVKYIEHPNAVIIWALAMKTDPSNSSTGKVILDCKAEKRCIGVLTNPDHIQVRHLEFENILRNQDHKVGHGFFVTKQPGEKFTLRGPDYHAQARQEETEFFDTEELWTGEWSSFRSRCGILAIQKFVSDVFADEIAKSIPDITAKIEARTAVVDADLRALPPLPDADILNDVHQCLVELSVDIRALMDGAADHALLNFKSAWTALADQFRSLILHIKPGVALNHPSDKELPETEYINLLSDDDDDDGFSSPVQNNRKRRPLSTLQSQAKRPHLNDTAVPIAPSLQPSRIIYTPSNGHSMKREDGQSQSQAPRPSVPPTRLVDPKSYPFHGSPFQQFSNLGKGFMTLESLREEISKHNNSDLPGIVNGKLYDRQCLQSVTPWRQPLEAFFMKTISMLRDQLDEALCIHLGKFQQTELYNSAQRHLHAFLDKYVVEQRFALNELYELETYRPFTINKDSIRDYEAKELKSIHDTRKIQRAQGIFIRRLKSGQEKKLDEGLTRAEVQKFIQKKAEEIKPEELGKDPFEQEVRVAAYIRAYYITAGNRFADSVALNISGNLFRKIRQNILFHLEGELKLKGNGADLRCRSLLEEDPKVRIQREELQEEKANLAGFSARLEELKKQTKNAKPVRQLRPFPNAIVNGEQPHGPSIIASGEDIEQSCPPVNGSGEAGRSSRPGI